MQAALVVGGGGVIGAQVVRRLLEHDPKIIAHVLDRQYGCLSKLPENLLSRVRFHPGNASNPEHVSCVFDCMAAEAAEVTHVLFAVGGMVPREPMEGFEKHLFANMQANYWSVYHPLRDMLHRFRAGSPLFRQLQTCIVLSTVDATIAFGDDTNCGYALAKALLERYLLAVAAALRGLGDPTLIVIRLGTVLAEIDQENNPRWADRLEDNPGIRGELGKRLKDGKVMTPEEVAANVVWWFCCPHPGHFHGTPVTMDKGLSQFGHCPSSAEPNPFANPNQSTDSDPKP